MNPQDAVIRLLNAGWTQARLAQKAGCSQSTIHRIKTGGQPRGASYHVCVSVMTHAASLPSEPAVAVDAHSELAP